jgi:hypothetical protein
MIPQPKNIDREEDSGSAAPSSTAMFMGPGSRA